MFPNLTEHAPNARVVSAELCQGAGQSKPHGGGEDETRSIAGRETDACFDKYAGGVLGMDIAELAPPNEEHVSEMDLLIGPLLERNGGYGYDTFTLAEGLRSSFRYRRVEEARYDQRALIAEAERDPRCIIRMCETLNEFNEVIEAARRDAVDPSNRS